MIHELAQAVGISDALANTLVATFGAMFVAMLTLMGIVIKNGKDVRTIRTRVTSDVEDRRHAQNTRRFAALERGQKETNKRLTKVETNLGIEQTFIPDRKKKGI